MILQLLILDMSRIENRSSSEEWGKFDLLIEGITSGELFRAWTELPDLQQTRVRLLLKVFEDTLNGVEAQLRSPEIRARDASAFEEIPARGDVHRYMSETLGTDSPLMPIAEEQQATRRVLSALASEFLSSSRGQ